MNSFHRLLYVALLSLLPLSLAAQGGWHVQNPWPSASSLTGISMRSSQSAVAVGYNGVVIATIDGGKSWRNLDVGLHHHLYGVQFIDEMNGHIVGLDGVILATSDGGESWSEQKSGVGDYLNAVSFSDPLHGLVVGGTLIPSGSILQTSDGGSTWTKRATPKNTAWNDVCFRDGRNCWVAGESGVILHSSNGGVDWAVQRSGGLRLTSIAFCDSLHGAALGDEGV